jgi:oligoribonuclease (3'-5' exoribonuclease)
MADIRESLNELRFYREIMFREATLNTSYKHQLGR